MRQLYMKEFVKYNNGLPFKVYMCEVERVNYHWHKEMEFIYVLKGSIVLEKSNQIHTISPNELVLVNSNELHQFYDNGTGNLAIVLQINGDYFKSMYPDIGQIYFEVNESIGLPGDYLEIKKLIQSILKVFAKKEIGYIIEMNALISSIMVSLLRHFRYSTHDWEEDTEEDFARLGRILHFIERNYMNKITLKELADMEFLSSYYFSHFFKQKLGISFQSYLKYVRIQKSHEMLIKTDKKIIDIALENGFSNLQTFINSFKEKYGETPSKFKKNLSKMNITYNDKFTEKKFNYTEIDIQVIIKILDDLLDS